MWSPLVCLKDGCKRWRGTERKSEKLSKAGIGGIGGIMLGSLQSSDNESHWRFFISRVVTWSDSSWEDDSQNHLEDFIEVESEEGRVTPYIRAVGLACTVGTELSGSPCTTALRSVHRAESIFLDSSWPIESVSLQAPASQPLLTSRDWPGWWDGSLYLTTQVAPLASQPCSAAC